MADIKTHLRELSVAFGIKGYDETLVNKITPSQYFEIAQKIIKNDISKADNFSHLAIFDTELISIILNGIRLGNVIVNTDLVNPSDSILWTGADTQKNDPVDLYVGNAGFSLKEDSYILENMGLYKYLNLMTNSDFKRGLHVFEEFAPTEYNEWFKYTWDLLISKISSTPWIFNNKGKYIAEITLNNSSVQLIIDGNVISTLPVNLSTVQQYTQFTTAVSREKIFSKWINNEISNDFGYINIKNNCSVTAGKNLATFVNQNLAPRNISRLLQIYPNSYFYAKTTICGIEIYHVPSQGEFLHEIKVHNVEYSVPSSQLNIHTTIENTKTGKSLVFRNECRFSHGQFNGTPEAKMYYERGNDLSVIYNKIV